MFYLFLCIVSSGALVLLFKGFERFGADTFRCLVVNYFTAALWCNLTTPGRPVLLTSFWQLSGFGYMVALGLLFICIFYSSALTAQRLGVAASVVAGKMSLVITVLWVAWYTGESVSAAVWVGIVCCIAALWLTTRPANAHGQKQTGNWWLPLVVFAGSGVVDSALKYLEATAFASGAAIDMLGLVFMSGGVFGSLFLVLKRPGEQGIGGSHTWKPLLGGLALGTLNFLSTFTMLKTLSLNVLRSHEVFPVLNVAVVAFTSIMGIVLFGEKLSRTNLAGIVLAMLSIGVIAWGSSY